jgi:hypothetical protein
LQFAQSAPHPTLGFWATGLLLGYAAMRLIAGPAGTDLVPDAAVSELSAMQQQEEDL